MSLLTKFARQTGASPQGGTGKNPMMGGFPTQNSFSGMFPFSAGTNLGSAAQAAQQNPNPLAQVKPGQHGLATASGVQQMAQKAAHEDWLKWLAPALYPLVN